MSPSEYGTPTSMSQPGPGEPGTGQSSHEGGPPTTPESAPSPSVWGRSARIFVSPMKAWDGLQTRSRWWFPLALLLVIQVVLLAATFQRALLPTMVESWNQAVDRGQMTPAQVDKFEDFFANNPMGTLVVVGQQAVAFPIIMLLVALVVWFGVGFVLGTKFSYRLALEVVCWAALVRVPETLLTFGIAWSQESFKGIHFGLGALLPAEDPATKLHAALGVLLDSVGPFSLWYLFVAIVGCSVLSGAPRKNVAWVLTGLYVALTVVFACVAGIFGPGA